MEDRLWILPDSQDSIKKQGLPRKFVPANVRPDILKDINFILKNMTTPSIKRRRGGRRDDSTVHINFTRKELIDELRRVEFYCKVVDRRARIKLSVPFFVVLIIRCRIKNQMRISAISSFFASDLIVIMFELLVFVHYFVWIFFPTVGIMEF